MRDVGDVGMWNVRDLECSVCWDMGYSGCGMFKIWDTGDVGFLGCEMFSM